MSTAPRIQIPGLDIKMNLGYQDRIQHFQDLWGSHYQCLESGSHTDMVFICPQDKKYIRVSEIYQSMPMSLL